MFINTEMYARASVAALFYKLANFTLEDGEREKNDAISSGKFFLLEMLDSAVQIIRLKITNYLDSIEPYDIVRRVHVCAI